MGVDFEMRGRKGEGVGERKMRKATTSREMCGINPTKYQEIALGIAIQSFIHSYDIYHPQATAQRSADTLRRSLSRFHTPARGLSFNSLPSHTHHLSAF